MGDNLFLTLRRCAPFSDARASKSYLTEIFAWVLRQNGDLSNSLFDFLASRQGYVELRKERSILWRTQFDVGFNRVDLVGESEDSVYLFEHRLWDDLSTEGCRFDQVVGELLWPGKVNTVLISAARYQHNGQADVELTWADIHRFLETWIKNHGSGVHVGDLYEFIKNEGLGAPAPVSTESILSYCSGNKLIPALERLFKEVAHDLMGEDLSRVYKSLGSSGIRKGPKVQKLLAGRLGLEFTSHRQPGIFVGVLLDGTDHLVKLSQEHLGPDFALILDFHVNSAAPRLSDLVHSEPYTRLRNRLSRDSDEYGFLDHYFVSRPRNERHLLYLRRPLVHVLTGSATDEEQRRKMKLEVLHVIDVLQRGGELEELTTRCFGKPEARGQENGYSPIRRADSLRRQIAGSGLIG